MQLIFQSVSDPIEEAVTASEHHMTIEFFLLAYVQRLNSLHDCVWQGLTFKISKFGPE